MDILTDETWRLLAATAPEHDTVQAEMVACADEHDPPIIGLEVGGVLRVLAHLADATRLFEFGSGFGYSTTWFAEEVADDTELSLTEHDAHELNMAREFLDQAGLAGRTTFLEGDALDLFEGVNGEFDLVLLDHQKHRYAEVFDLASDRVAVGEVIVADNVMRGPVNFGALTDWSESRAEALDGADADTHGTVAFPDAAQTGPRYETIVLPVGSSLMVNTRVE